MKYVTYCEDYLELLEKYFNNSTTPVNNKNHRIFKTHLYDGIQGIAAMMIDNNEIVAISSAILINENGIVSCKFPHRLHIRKDYTRISSKFIDQYWDPLVYKWLDSISIRNVYCTFNEGNNTAFLWAALRHARRIKYLRCVNVFGKLVLDQNWFIYPTLINEMDTWQYLIYSSPIDDWFYPYKFEKSIDDDMSKLLDAKFTFISGRGWQI